MHIVWYGLGCVKIMAKYGGTESSVVIAPFDAAKAGLKLPRNLSGDIVINPEHVGSAEGRFLIDGPGEFEVGGTFVWGVPLNPATKECLWKIEAEDMILVHAGALSRVPDDSELTAFENVDVLLVPVGGHGVLNAAQAADLVTRLEPRVVVPIWHHVAGGTQELDGAEAFVKALGSPSESVSKLKLAKKDLPVDQMKIFLLSPDGT
jgi:L-ascorbate metabolism protein UlaG (beta-lactamase superfamily)